jgi:hypothetical protein
VVGISGLNVSCQACRSEFPGPEVMVEGRTRRAAFVTLLSKVFRPISKRSAFFGVSEGIPDDLRVAEAIRGARSYFLERFGIHSLF